MPEPQGAGRDEFLVRVAARLPFDRAENRDILKELEDHLADTAATLEADGLSPEEAERSAIERLGPPDRLADSLTEARRSPRRLLAAAGAGTYAALGGVLYGYFYALLVVMGISIATVLLATSPFHLFGGNWRALLDTTTTTVAALAIAAYVAGRRLTSTAAPRAGYHIRSTRRTTALVGGSIVLWFALFGWRGTLTWPEVGMVLSLPVWFVIGAWHATEAPFPSRRWRLGVIFLALVFVPAALLFGFGQPAGSQGGSFYPAGAERIGLPRPPTVDAAVVGGGDAGALQTIWVTVDDPGILAGWTDLRVEAWRGVTRGEPLFGPGWTVDPGATAPYAIAEARLQLGPSSFRVGTREESVAPGSAVLRGDLRIDGAPDVTLAWTALTGVGPDGRRYVLEGPSFTTTAFNGTVADWLVAIASRR